MEDEILVKILLLILLLETATNIFADIVLEEDVNSSIELEQATASRVELFKKGFDTDVVKLIDAEKNRALFKLPKEHC